MPQLPDLRDPQARQSLALPEGAEPLPGGHLGRASQGMTLLQTRHAVVMLVVVAVAAGGLMPLIWAVLLFVWTRAHPSRRGSRGWATLARVAAVPSSLVAFVPASLALTALQGGASTTAALGVLAVLLVATGLPAFALWATHRHAAPLLGERHVAQPLRIAARAAVARFALIPAAIGALFAATATGLVSPEVVLVGAVVLGGGELALGLTALGGLFVASRRLALRDLPDPTRAPTAQITLWRRRLRMELGLDLVAMDGVLGASGAARGRALRLAVETATDPARVGVEVLAPALEARLPTLVLRGRAAGEPAGVALPDPILGRLVCAEGVDQATLAVLVSDLHEPLLAVLQAWPGSRVEAGKVHLKGHLSLSSAQAPPEQPGLVELVEAALALAEALDAACPRLPR